MVRDASRILHTGAVAASKPVSAKKVRALAVATLAKVIGTGANGSYAAPLAPRSTNSQITASSGRILIATVTIDRPPAARTPMALTTVSSTTQPMAIETTIPAPPNRGSMNDSADP